MTTIHTLRACSGHCNIRRCTGKYSVTIKNSKGNIGKGFYWITDSGILVRMEMSITADGKQQQFVMYLTNLVLAAQPASLFEIPAGFSELAFGIPSLPR